MPEEGQNTFRASLHIPDTTVVALYSGNFEEYQGVDLLVDAAVRVAGAQFVFMGGETAEVGAARARAGGAADRCVFAGKRPPSDLPVFVVAFMKAIGD